MPWNNKLKQYSYLRREGDAAGSVSVRRGQFDKVIDWWLDVQLTITDSEARDNLAISRLGAIIYVFRREVGAKIYTRHVMGTNRFGETSGPFAEYTLHYFPGIYPLDPHLRAAMEAPGYWDGWVETDRPDAEEDAESESEDAEGADEAAPAPAPATGERKDVASDSLF